MTSASPRPSFRAPRFRAALLSAALALSLAGCASTQKTASNPDDPLEPVNRVIYSVNDNLDRYFLKPVATGYKTVLPQFVRTGVTNFFSNLNDVVVAVNNLLQGKLNNAAQDATRLAVNSTVGIGGVFDVAKTMGLPKHDEDFGQTLGWWGVGPGPYLQIPLMGPSDMRDAVGRVADYEADPIRWGLRHNIPLRNSLWGVQIVNTRANLLDASQMLEDAALDPYEFQRDAYLQHRNALVHDGDVPSAADQHSEDDPGPTSPIKPATPAASAEPVAPAPAAEAPAKQGAIDPALLPMATRVSADSVM